MSDSSAPVHPLDECPPPSNCGAGGARVSANLYLILQSQRCKVNRIDLGIELADGRILVPQELGAVLTTVGAWTCDSLAKALRDFPSAFMLGLNLSESDFSSAREGALGKIDSLSRTCELTEKATHPKPGAH